MPPADDLDDDFVADLLSKEAAECALKYSAMGMDAYTKSSKRPANHPTPNTRFLNNIVRATNNHNRNLLAQERADSQARLDDLDRIKQEKQRAADERERRLRPGPGDTRKRILGDIRAIIGAPSRKRKANEENDSQDTEHEPESESRKSRKILGRHDDRGEERRHSRHHHDHRPSKTKDRDAKRELFAGHGPKRGLAREEYDREDQSDAESRRHRHRRSSRERSRRSGTRGNRSRERAGESHEDRRSERSSRHHANRRHSTDRGHSSHRRASKKATSPQHSEDNSDSDPLDDIIGPKPPSPVRRRGRGTISGSSGIEGRFASDYDPKTDVSLDQDEDDDWGTALEALRDRARWKQQGAERLRAAGFTDEQVTKWEKGGERSEEDVRWRKKGEEREWDRGKTLFKESG